ncbi:MAG: hypothetical protein RIA64_02725 [Rhodospirillales bacterium]
MELILIFGPSVFPLIIGLPVALASAPGSRWRIFGWVLVAIGVAMGFLIWHLIDVIGSGIRN